MVKVVLLVVAMVVVKRLIQNNDGKRKMANSKRRSPDESHIFPLSNGCGLTTHELIDISTLTTFMV